MNGQNREDVFPGRLVDIIRAVRSPHLTALPEQSILFLKYSTL